MRERTNGGAVPPKPPGARSSPVKGIDRPDARAYATPRKGMNRQLIRLFTFGLLLLCARADDPKLVVAILVDQMRYDYLERFAGLMPPGGFKLLTEHGASMTFARYNYCPTVTGPGHASFLSGATPAMHGIIANDWFDRQTGKKRYCVEDTTVEGVGTKTAKGRMSPRNFTGTTLADQMRLAFGSKVVGVSMKDRGAILPAGKKPTGAYWFEAASGDFVTSTYYKRELPGWVKEFNGRRRPAQFMGQTWDRLLSPNDYPTPDAAPGEGLMPGETNVTFPHTILPGSSGGFDTITSSPFGNQLLAEFAQAAVEGEGLGLGARPDLLCVSFSSIDYVGHRFGPYSQEVQDITLRLDRQLAELFAYLDKKVGLGHTLIVLTADHGVAPTPEYAAAQGLDGSRVTEAGLMKEIDAALAARFGPGDYFQWPEMFDGNVYLNREALKQKGIQVAEAADTIREWALASGKFQACYSREQLLDGRAPGLVGRLVVNGYNPERGGDVVLILKPYIIAGTGKTGTTHGSPYNFDTHVPVLFYGAGIRPGRYADEFNITDIAPTLCAALRIEEPSGCMGKPFVKALLDP